VISSFICRSHSRARRSSRMSRCWRSAAQAHRVVGRGIPGEVVLIVDDDLAAALEA
jgi:hypothetical protein